MKLLKPIFLMLAMALSMVSMTAYAEDLDDVTVQVINSDDTSMDDVDNNINMPDADHEDAQDDHSAQGHEDASDDDSSHDDSMSDDHEDEHEEMDSEHEDEQENEDEHDSNP